MALVLFILGTIGFAMLSLLKSSKQVREGVVMIVELKDGFSAEQRDSLQLKIADNRLVAAVDFVSKDEKLADEDFRRAFDIDIKDILSDNPLPDSFDVTLSSAAAEAEELEAFVQDIKQLDGVSYVSYPKELIAQVHSVLDVMQLLIFAFGAVMLVISFVLLGNTVRLAIFSHREAIKTMKLVGATKWFIIRPFLGRSLLQGLLAGVVATMLFVAALFGLQYSLPGFEVMAQLQMVAVVAGAMVVLGIVLSTLFTFVAVNKCVNMRSNKLYLY
jgi:cell division transport system permease protein